MLIRLPISLPLALALPFPSANDDSPPPSCVALHPPTPPPNPPLAPAPPSIAAAISTRPAWTPRALPVPTDASRRHIRNRSTSVDLVALTPPRHYHATTTLPPPSRPSRSRPPNCAKLRKLSVARRHRSSQRLPTTPLRSQHLRHSRRHFWPPHDLLQPQSRLVAGQQLGPKSGLRHPDFCCVLGTTLSLY